MPEQEKRYGTKITTLGASRITACILAGTKLKITQAAAGDGGGGYYVPTVDQTELVGELWRGPVVSAVQNPAVPNMLDVKIVIDDSVGNFVCREVGLFSEAGELIAICNTPDTEKVATSTGVDGRLTMVMHIVVADASVLEFTIIPVLDVVSREELERAISDHDTDPAAHEDIRQAIADAVEAHDSAADAHPVLQNITGDFNTRLAALELKCGISITGKTDPTAQTTAQVGQVYLNTTTGQEFVCIAVTEEGTVWEPRGTTQSGIPTVEVTQEEYDALGEEDKQGETLYVLPDGVGGLEIRYKGKVLSNGPSIVAGENVKLEEKDGELIISFPSFFQELTQEEYDAIGENKPKMLYLVTG